MGMKPSLALEEGDSATIWKRSTQEELKLRHKASSPCSLIDNPHLWLIRLAVTSDLPPTPDMAPRRNN